MTDKYSGDYRIRNGIRRLFRLGVHRPDRAVSDLDAELHHFLDERTAQLTQQGVPPHVARAEAERRFGASMSVARESLGAGARHRERRLRWLDHLHDVLQDVRYATRGLLRRPGFAAVAVLTLALGIGANTAIFSAVNALLVKPLPFREPERLMQISLVPPADGSSPLGEASPWSFAKFVVFRDAQRTFSDLALQGSARFNLIAGEQAERVDGEWVSARYLATLGIVPAAGHDFAPEMDVGADAAKRTIISDALWLRLFNRDPGAIGRTIRIDGQSFEIIGVMPRGARGISGRAELLIPITTRNIDQVNEAWSLEFNLVGRLKAGFTTTQGTSEANRLGKVVYDASPMTGNAMGPGAKAGWSATAAPLDGARVSGQLRRSVLLLFGAVGFVLLIACVNLANMLLGRAAARRREIAIRAAIGAGRGRLVRMLMVESVLLALAGGTASVAVAWWGTRALATASPGNYLGASGLDGLGVVGFESIHLDPLAFAFTLLVSIVVGVLFGLVPALQTARLSMMGALKDAGGGALAGMSRLTSRRVLVVCEVAMAIVLLSGSGLLIRSLANRMQVNPGFDASNLLTLRLTLSPGQVARDSLPGFYDLLLARLQGVPGVQSVSLGDCPPLNGGCNVTLLSFPDHPEIPRTNASSIGVHVVTPGWFGALRVPIVRGRVFNSGDRLGSPKVMLVSESAARKFWPDQDPIGKRAAVWQGGFHTGAEVIGIVRDVRYGAIDSLPGPDAYLSYNQAPYGRMMIFVRTAGDPLAVAPMARRAIHDMSSSYVVDDIRTMAERTAAATAQSRFMASLLSLFAAFALALSAIGIYGVMSFGVLQRTRELGIRMALGASRGAITRIVLTEGALLATVGTVIGISGALAMSGALRSLLYEVAPSDPSTYVAIVLVLGAVSLLASWIPARRAASVDPLTALREG